MVEMKRKGTTSISERRFKTRDIISISANTLHFEWSGPDRIGWFSLAIQANIAPEQLKCTSNSVDYPLMMYPFSKR